MSKRPNPLKQNLAPEYVVAARYGETDFWVVGWVFSSRSAGEETMREVARLLVKAEELVR